MAHWGDEDGPFDWQAKRDDDLGFYGFVFLLVVLTLTVVALWVI